MGYDFVNHFAVARIGGRWRITRKADAHTGGALPVE